MTGHEDKMTYIYQNCLTIVQTYLGVGLYMEYVLYPNLTIFHRLITHNLQKQSMNQIVLYGTLGHFVFA